MARDKIIKAGFLNVVATPHPVGVYERLCRTAAGRPVRFWGESHAAITNFRKINQSDHYFTGLLKVWTEVNADGPGIDKSRLEEITFDTDIKDLTRRVGFNLRVFRFILNTESHVITIELFTDTGHGLSPRRAETIFSHIFSPSNLGVTAEYVDVTLIPEDDALQYVLSLNRIDRIEIVIKRPNTDDITRETNEVLAKLRAQNAKRQETTLLRAPKTDGLRLDEDNAKLARVAAGGDGSVYAKGRNSSDEPAERSTKEYPKVVERTVPAGTTFLTALTDIARSMAGLS